MRVRILWLFLFLASCTSFTNNKSKNNTSNNNTSNNSNNTNPIPSDALEVLSRVELVSRLDGYQVADSVIIRGDDGNLHAFLLLKKNIPSSMASLKVLRFFSGDQGSTWQEGGAGQEFQSPDTYPFLLTPAVSADGTTLVGVNFTLFFAWKSWRDPGYAFFLPKSGSTLVPDSGPIVIPRYEDCDGFVKNELFMNMVRSFAPGQFLMATESIRLEDMTEYTCSIRDIPTIFMAHVHEDGGQLTVDICGQADCIYGLSSAQAPGKREIGIYPNSLPARNRVVSAIMPDGFPVLLARNNFHAPFQQLTPEICMSSNIFISPDYVLNAPEWYITQADSTHWQPPKVIRSNFLKEFNLNNQGEPPSAEWYQLSLLDMAADDGGRIYLLATLYRERNNEQSIPIPYPSTFSMLFRIQYDPQSESPFANMDLVTVFPENLYPGPQRHFVKGPSGLLGVSLHDTYLYKDGEPYFVGKEPCPLLLAEDACGRIAVDGERVSFETYRLHSMGLASAQMDFSATVGPAPLESRISIDYSAGGETPPLTMYYYPDANYSVPEIYEITNYPRQLPPLSFSLGETIAGIKLLAHDDDPKDYKAFPSAAALAHIRGTDPEDSFTASMFSMEYGFFPVAMDAGTAVFQKIQSVSSETPALKFCRRTDTGEVDNCFLYEYTHEWSQYIGPETQKGIKNVRFHDGKVIIHAWDLGGMVVEIWDPNATPQPQQVTTIAVENTSGIGYLTGNSLDILGDILVIEAVLPDESLYFFNLRTGEFLGYILTNLEPSMHLWDAYMKVAENGYIVERSGVWLAVIDPGSIMPGHAGSPRITSFANRVLGDFNFDESEMSQVQMLL